MKRMTFICMVLLVDVCAAFVPPAVANMTSRRRPEQTRQSEFPRFLQTIGSAAIQQRRSDAPFFLVREG